MAFTVLQLFYLLLAPTVILCNGGVGKLKILQAQQGENMVYSPLSVYTALGMTYFGANGNSKAQIKTTLFNHVADSKLLTDAEDLKNVLNFRSDSCNITLASRAYSSRQYPLLDTYKDTISKFGSDIVPIDFNDEAVPQINRWVSEKTNDKINNLIQAGSLSADTALVLVNALHLKAEWEEKFSADSTSRKVFYSTPSKNFTVSMMENMMGYYYYTDNSDVQVLGIPFKTARGGGPELVMFIVLPKEKFGLKRYESSITDVGQFQQLFEQSRKVETSQVTESGVEAAAATFMKVTQISALMGPEFNANHPFLFAIVDRRNYNPLFLGRYVGN